MCGTEVRAEVIEDRYRNNVFRSSLPRPKEWRVSRFNEISINEDQSLWGLTARRLDWLEALELWNFGFAGFCGRLTSFVELL